MNQDIDIVAHNLKILRESRKLSLDQLSQRTGVSKSMLRQIENGKSSPTIATIWKIANGLKISFTTLLRKPAVEAEVRGFKDEEPLTGEKNHYRLYPIIPFEPERSFETYYVEIDPETTFYGEPHEGNVYEYIFVKQGTLQVTVDGKEMVVNEDQFLQFQANCPHEYKNVGDGMAAVLMQISYLS
ncbi:helix-turn-helix domain-containing protein [Maridesulfovibrio sp.]|uniref:helix-turn-helix domain-containing protein n=1 Tax=Maridesulfovibrio sp. TaxID=2795000 RepID=UPI003BA95D84